MKLLVLLILSLTSNYVLANLVVVDNKAYSLKEVEKKQCGEIGGPLFAAESFLLDATYKLGLEFSMAQCSAGEVRHCDSQSQKKYALRSLFKLVRQYPPAHRAVGCRELRIKGCTNVCQKERVYSDEHCLIECNQYESYNR